MRSSFKDTGAGLFLLACAALTFEILETRIFSLILWHHLTYLVVGVAIMGLGAGGIWVYLKKNADYGRLPGWASVAFAVSAVLSIAVLSRIPLDLQDFKSPWVIIRLLAYYLLITPPYIFAGAGMSAALARRSDRIFNLYFANLLGSGLGCILVVLLLPRIGAESLVILCSILGLAAAMTFGWGESRRPVKTASVVLIVLLLLLPARFAVFPFTPCLSKMLGGYRPDFNREYSRWSPIGRVDVLGHQEKGFVKIGLESLGNDYKYNVPYKIINTDGDASTYMFNFKGIEISVQKEIASRIIYGAPYLLPTGPDVLIIGVGGTSDVFAAHLMGSEGVTGIELNPRTVEAITGPYAKFLEDRTLKPGTKIINDEGRHYLRSHPESYDLIQMTATDTWAALTSGAYLLSENYLYTTDAFREYLNHLKPDGRLSITRWIFDPPREMIRLCSLSVAALRQMGYEHPEKHIIVIQQGIMANVMTRKEPFTDEEIDSLRNILAEQESDKLFLGGKDIPSLKLIYPNPEGPETNFRKFFEAVASGSGGAFEKKYLYNISPVDDNSPFFFQYYRWKNLGHDITHAGHLHVAFFNLPLDLLSILMSLSTVLLIGIVLVIIPVAYAHKRPAGWAGYFIYFSALGLGFIMIEMVFIQKFVLFLGHPTYSLSVTLFSLLMFSGFGSAAAGRLKGSGLKVPAIGVAGIIVGLAAFALLSGPVFDRFLQAGFTVRVIASLCLIAIPGLAMGIPFPSGLAFAEERSKGIIPWAWAINGIASVIGSFAGVILAMRMGFWSTLTVAGAVYAVGLAGLALNRSAKGAAD